MVFHSRIYHVCGAIVYGELAIHSCCPTTQTPLPPSQWSYKLQPLAYNLQHQFHHHCLPATEISIDKMMVCFTGRSNHTTMIKGVPIAEGYKVLALCQHGYTFSFMFTSNSESISNMLSLYHGVARLSTTSQTVFQLATTLPAHHFGFTLYCDNYFSNIPLFAALREYPISPSGIVQTNSAPYLLIFKLDQWNSGLPWNTVSGIVSGNVLAFVWQDKILVHILTTVHEATPVPENYAFQNWPRPYITDTN